MQRHKPLVIDPNADLDVYFDQILMPSDTTSGQFRLFGPDPTAGDTLQNYVNNPFPQREAHYVVGLGFEALLPIIRGSANINVLQLINALGEAVVRWYIGGGRDKILHAPLAMFMNLQDLDYRRRFTHTPAGVATEVTDVFLKTTPTPRLPAPFVLEPGVSHELYVEFGTDFVADLPSAANWAADGQSGGQDFGLRATIQYALSRN